MKLDMTSVTVQIILQGTKALLSMGMVAGIAILFVRDETGAISQTWEGLTEMSSLFSGFVS